MGYGGWNQRGTAENRPLTAEARDDKAFAGHHAFAAGGTRSGHFEVFRLEAGNDLRGPSGGQAKGPGWFWWPCEPGSPPHGDPSPPFPTAEAAYRAAVSGGTPMVH